MRSLMMTVFGVVLGASLLGCGPTVGDACTTNDDCGEGICLNERWSPGGYCSKSCNASEDDDEDCPTGSVCTQDALGIGRSVCLLECSIPRDCRTGYRCETTPAASARVCVGPEWE